MTRDCSDVICGFVRRDWYSPHHPLSGVVPYDLYFVCFLDHAVCGDLQNIVEYIEDELTVVKDT